MLPSKRGIANRCQADRWLVVRFPLLAGVRGLLAHFSRLSGGCRGASLRNFRGDKG
jgi:hypothetical protein